MTPRNAGRSVLAALAASTSLALAGVVPVDDEIFANGFELPTIACGWNTTLGNPGGSLSTLDLWNGDLYVGGSQAGPFGGVNGGVAQIDLATGTVSPLGTTELVDGFVNDFIGFDDGGGEQLYLLGAFNGIRFDGSELPGSRAIVAWDGSTISTIDSPFSADMGFAWSGAIFNDELVVGGSVGFPQTPLLGFWDGANWRSFSTELEGTVAPIVMAMEVFDGDLYIAGRFDLARVPGEPVVESKNVMGFDGTDFFTVGGGVRRATNPVSQVLALKTFDNGDGEALYIGGRFDQSATGIPLLAVAKWDGTTLSAVGAGFPTPNEVRGFEVHDDGSGPALYATGTFVADALGTPMRRFAKLEGDTWVEVAGGIGENPGRMASLPDGSLVVGGSFTEVGVVGTVPGSGASNGIAVLECGVPE